MFEGVPILGAIFGFIGAFSILFIAIAIVLYVFGALGFYTLAKNDGIPEAWIAWIPIFQYWLLGKLINNKLWGFGGTSWVLIILNIINIILGYYSGSNSVISTITGILTLVTYIYVQCAFYKLYKIYRPQSAVLFLVLGIIFPFLVPIFVFVIRKNQRNLVVD